MKATWAGLSRKQPRMAFGRSAAARCCSVSSSSWFDLAGEIVGEGHRDGAQFDQRQIVHQPGIGIGRIDAHARARSSRPRRAESRACARHRHAGRHGDGGRSCRARRYRSRPFSRAGRRPGCETPFHSSARMPAATDRDTDCPPNATRHGGASYLRRHAVIRQPQVAACGILCLPETDELSFLGDRGTGGGARRRTVPACPARASALRAGS